MPQKKDKNVKVKDLAPKKDAKGGVAKVGLNVVGSYRASTNAGGGSLDGGGHNLDRGTSGAN